MSCRNRVRRALTLLFACLSVALPGCGQATPTTPRLTDAAKVVLAEVLAPRPIAREYANRTRMGTGALFQSATPPALASGAATATEVRAAAPAPARVDLRPEMPPVYHQGPFMSCTAFTVAKGLGEYLLRRKGDHTPLSAAHFYAASAKAAQTIDVQLGLDVTVGLVLAGPLHLRFDDGRSLAAAMATLENAGAVPEAERPYPGVSDWDEYVADLAQAARAAEEHPTFIGGEPGRFVLDRFFDYTKVDPDGTFRNPLDEKPAIKIRRAVPARTLQAVRRSLARKMPVALGVLVFEGAYGPEAARTGRLALPRPGEREVGGHAMLAVGYDDTAQAVLVRNSWGPGWGEGGYGWLPYAAFEAGFVRDGWTVAGE